jgi:WD40 repeat protein
MLALGDWGGNITLWNTATREPVDPPLRHNLGSVVHSVAFSPDGKLLASGAEDNTVVLWNVQTHEPMYRLTGHTNYIATVVFSPDGKILISSGDEIILWDVETGQPIGQPLRGTGILTFSSDGKTLASAGGEGIILWDLDPESWIKVSCLRAGRNFTRSEWKRYFPNEKYPISAEKVTCRDWPVEIELTPSPTP